MVSGVSQMDSEWWKTPRFRYGKVLGSFGKFRVKPGKVWNLLERGGTMPAVGRPYPGEAHQTGRLGWPSRWGGRDPPPSRLNLRGRGVPPPHSFRCVLFPFRFGQVELELVWNRVLVGLRKPMASCPSLYIRDPGDKTRHNKPQPRPPPPALAPTPAPAPDPTAAARHRPFAALRRRHPASPLVIPGARCSVFSSSGITPLIFGSRR
jgi:hypothetical protein